MILIHESIDRKCHLCISRNIGDEFHCLPVLECQCLKERRNLYLDKYYQSGVNMIKLNRQDKTRQEKTSLIFR